MTSLETAKFSWNNTYLMKSKTYCLFQCILFHINSLDHGCYSNKFSVFSLNHFLNIERLLLIFKPNSFIMKNNIKILNRSGTDLNKILSRLSLIYCTIRFFHSPFSIITFFSEKQWQWDQRVIGSTIFRNVIIQSLCWTV